MRNRYQPQLWDSVTVLSRIWNIWCGRTFSGHFSQEHFAAGFSMEICFRYAAGSHSSHEHIESLSHWSAASWDGLAHQFVHHAPILSSTKKSETMRTSKSSRILLWTDTCDVHTSSFIRRLTRGWSIPKPNRNRVAAGGTWTEWNQHWLSSELAAWWDWSLILVLFVNGLRDSLVTIGGRLIYSPRYWLGNLFTELNSSVDHHHFCNKSNPKLNTSRWTQRGPLNESFWFLSNATRQKKMFNKRVIIR